MLRAIYFIPDDMVCGRSFRIAEAARSNWRVSCKFGHVDVGLFVTISPEGVLSPLLTISEWLAPNCLERDVNILFGVYKSNIVVTVGKKNQDGRKNQLSEFFTN